MPQAMRANGRYAAVVLHDVAPARWAGCLRVMRQVEQVARAVGVDVPLTLLVVPAMHGATETPPHYLRWLRQLARQGHELALHGWTHRDEAAPDGTLAGHALRRWYTAGEGEFWAIDRAEAARRLALGQAWAASHRFEMRGFVAPAWLLGAPARQAVEAAGFDYTCSLSRIVDLRGGRELPARSLVFSTRSAWRRQLSRLWNRSLAARLRDAPLWRFELHPNDADFPSIRRCWSDLLARALREREPLRLAQTTFLAHPPGTPCALHAT